MVITTVSGDEKAAHAKTAGADHVINYLEENVAERIMEITGGDGVDRVVEVEFGDVAPVLAAGAVIATYGSMGAPTPTLPFYDLMFKSVTLKMYLVYLLNDKARAMTINGINEALESGSIKHAIAKCIPLAKSAEAHKLVESASEMGNIVISID